MQKLILFNEGGKISETKAGKIGIIWSDYHANLREIWIGGKNRGEFNIMNTGYLIEEVNPEDDEIHHDQDPEFFRKYMKENLDISKFEKPVEIT